MSTRWTPEKDPQITRFDEQTATHGRIVWLVGSHSFKTLWAAREFAASPTPETFATLRFDEQVWY